MIQIPEVGMSQEPRSDARCNGRCHEAGELGVYLDLDCPKHVTAPVRAWLDDDLADEEDDN